MLAMKFIKYGGKQKRGSFRNLRKEGKVVFAVQSCRNGSLVASFSCQFWAAGGRERE